MLPRIKDAVPVLANHAGGFWRALEEPAFTTRSWLPAHVTTSCIVFDSTLRNVLLVLHRKYEEWVYPGGHADGDWLWVRSALRECHEETSLQSVRLLPQLAAPDELLAGDLPLRLALPQFIQEFSIPRIGAMPAHTHYDAVYILVADATDVRLCEAESRAIGWYGLAELEDLARADEPASPDVPSALTARLCLYARELTRREGIVEHAETIALTS